MRRFLSFALSRDMFAIVILSLSMLNCSGMSSEKLEKQHSRYIHTAPSLIKKIHQQARPIYIRIFKHERALELWVVDGGVLKLDATYPICTISGDLGPKLHEGDEQSPEGLYTVTREALNPNSKFHLSFNLGYPNDHDRSLGRTGSYLMVHGGCQSAGCYAMTDPTMELLYAYAEAAFDGGQEGFRVDIFPFRMKSDMMERHAASPWIEFWGNLRQAYTLFEQTNYPPIIVAMDQFYRLEAANSYPLRADNVASVASVTNVDWIDAD